MVYVMRDGESKACGCATLPPKATCRCWPPISSKSRASVSLPTATTSISSVPIRPPELSLSLSDASAGRHAAPADSRHRFLRRFLSDGKQLVFERGVPDRSVIEVRIAQADGSGERLVAALPAFAGFIFGATWSPDGKTIAAPTLGVGADASWILNTINVSDGRVSALLAGGGRAIGRAVWMPDGNSLIAAVSESTLGRGQLQSIDYPKGELHRFTNDLSDYTAALDVTHDGKTLAAIQRTRVFNIWTAPAADSSQARQLSSGERIYTQIAPGPSGKLLATGANGDIWLMNSDGTQPAVLIPDAHNTDSISSCGDRYVLFDSFRSGKLELWRADADGSNGKKMVDADPEAGDSQCSPDGKWIFYAGKDSIFRMPVEGGDPVALVAVPGAGNSLKVSPDGSQLAFAYQEGSPVPTPKIAMVPTAGGPRQFISQVPLGTRGLFWSPSGKALQYGVLRNGAANIWEQPLSSGPPAPDYKLRFRPDPQLLLVARRKTALDDQGQHNQRRNSHQQLPVNSQTRTSGTLAPTFTPSRTPGTAVRRLSRSARPPQRRASTRAQPCAALPLNQSACG